MFKRFMMLAFEDAMELKMSWRLAVVIIVFYSVMAVFAYYVGFQPYAHLPKYIDGGPNIVAGHAQ